jgi:uncharacterized protein YoaH (UPF0181 family)
MSKKETFLVFCRESYTSFFFNNEQEAIDKVQELIVEHLSSGEPDDIYNVQIYAPTHKPKLSHLITRPDDIAIDRDGVEDDNGNIWYEDEDEKSVYVVEKIGGRYSGEIKNPYLEF